MKVQKLRVLLFLLRALTVLADPLRDPTVLTSGSTRKLHVVLDLDVLNVRLRNGLSFRTLAYNGGIPGPTLSVRAGDTLEITLRNNLQAAISATLPCAPDNCTELHGSTFKLPNTTNLHTHGLHVSSALGADNVLDVHVGPGETYKYTIHIPNNHMAGLFWYHPHLEGATALQAAGGCAGALIVREPYPRRRGLPAWLTHIPTKTVVLQQLAMAQLHGLSLYSSNDTVFRVENPAGLPPDWADQDTENNQHPYPSPLKTRDHAAVPSPFDPSQIDNIALVNGQYQPTIHMIAGHWQRWQLLNAGGLFFLDLTLHQCELQLIAIDGIYLQTAPRLIQHIVMTPAGRADVLVRCMQAGRHILSSGNTTGASGEWNADMYWTPVFANVYVHSGDPHQDQHEPDGGNHSEVTPVRKLWKFEVERPYYLRDLRPIPQNQTSAFAFTFQDVVLVNNDTSPDAHPLFPLNGDAGGTCTFNKMTFKRDTPLLTMAFNSVQEWVVDGVSKHPLHIHINPMQIQAFIKDGVVTQAECDDEYGFLCVGDWVDTLQVPDAVRNAGAVVRFRVADFKGNDVVHCHYLIHEDQGCLTYARIV